MFTTAYSYYLNFSDIHASAASNIRCYGHEVCRVKYVPNWAHILRVKNSIWSLHSILDPENSRGGQVEVILSA